MTVLAFVVPAVSWVAQAESRVALLVGNSTYTGCGRVVLVRDRTARDGQLRKQAGRAGGAVQTARGGQNSIPIESA